MANPIVHPEKEYKIAQVGPTRDWDFTGNDGQKIAMRTYSIQVEGVADWVDLNTKSDGDAPTVGETLEGHIEDGGKYGYKFVKKKKGGNWSGGSKGYSAGAAWSAAFETSATITAAYYAASGSKPKDFDEFFGRVEAVAKKVKDTVDALAKASAPAESTEAPKTESESGESPAPADEPIQLDTISEDALGKW